jgi:hypothetical protein
MATLPQRGTFLVSASRTTTQTQADQENEAGHKGIRVVVDMTVVGTGSVTVTIQAKDPLSGKYTTLLASAAIIANGTTVLQVFPGAPETANLSANKTLGRDWRILATANNANAATYSVSYELLP